MTSSANSDNTDSFSASLQLLSNTTVSRYVDAINTSMCTKILSVKLLKPDFNYSSNSSKLVE